MDLSSSRSHDEWHIDFQIPELDVFSAYVVNAINTGVVTGGARREIVQVLRTYVLAYTSNLTSEHYNTICRKLVDKYPKLQDTEGDSRYVSTINIFILFYMLDLYRGHGRLHFDTLLRTIGRDYARAHASMQIQATARQANRPKGREYSVKTK